MVIQRGLPAWPGHVTPGPVVTKQAACEPHLRAAQGGAHHRQEHTPKRCDEQRAREAGGAEGKARG